MMILRFKSEEDHEQMLKKVKKMRKFTEELEDCLEEMIDHEEVEYRGGRYRDNYDDYDEREGKHDGRYGYRRGSRRM